MRVASYTVQAMSVGNNHIYYTKESPVGGTFVITIIFPDRLTGGKLWNEFIARHPDPIYYSNVDPSQFSNHCEFHGNFGGNKVYKYVR